MTRKPYPTDLTDDQWGLLESLLPKPKSGTRRGGRPPADLREVVNAVFHHLRGGLAWRLDPFVAAPCERGRDGGDGDAGADRVGDPCHGPTDGQPSQMHSAQPAPRSVR